MKNKLVSVIVPTYGRSIRIKECIDSLMNQTYKNIEIIVVDDNPSFSQDRKQTLQRLEKYSDVKIILMEKNSGACLARNKGIEESRGEYITFLDDDDIYYPEKVEKQVEFLEKNLEIDFVGCNMKVFVENKSIYKKDVECSFGSFSKFSIEGVLFTPMLMIRRNQIFEVGLFSDTSKFQDHLLGLKLLSKNLKGGVVKESLFRHTIHSGERITYTNKYAEALKNIENIENENLEKYSKFEKKLLKLKRLRVELGIKQNLTKRNKLNEIYLLVIYFFYLIKGCQLKYIKDGIKILFGIIISPSKLIEIKLRLNNSLKSKRSY